MNLDHKQLDHLLATLADSDIQEFCLEGKDFRLEIKRNLPSPSGPTLVNVPSASNEIAQVVVPPVAAASAPVNDSLGTPPPAAASTKGEFIETVSYTHLTLPTICSV